MERQFKLEKVRSKIRKILDKCGFSYSEVIEYEPLDIQISTLKKIAKNLKVRLFKNKKFLRL